MSYNTSWQRNKHMIQSFDDVTNILSIQSFILSTNFVLDVESFQTSKFLTILCGYFTHLSH